MADRKLVAVVGALAATMLVSYVPKFEGAVLVARPDPVGIVTACMGETKDVKLGQRFTPEECVRRLEERLAEHAAGVDQCTPLAPMTWYQRVAFVDFAYNVGVGAYCKSTMAKKGAGTRLCRRLRRAVSMDLCSGAAVSGAGEASCGRAGHVRGKTAMNGYVITGTAAGLLGILIGAGGACTYESRALAIEQAAHAKDNEQHAGDLLQMSKAALDGEQRAFDAHATSEAKIAAADAQLTKERQDHEKDNDQLRRALATGTQRLRVAVTGCSAAGSNGVPGTTSAAGVGNGATAYADVDPATAERIFGVAADDDNEISKVKALQAYVCAVRPATVGCKGN